MKMGYYISPNGTWQQSGQIFTIKLLVFDSGL